MGKKKVFVSGCYDMLHSGHVAFFEEAATHGDLYVGIGSDKTIHELKARKTIHTEDERLYMVSALKSVKEAWVNSGSGVLDFVEDMKRLQPDIFFVNSDGHTPAKEQLCRELGIQYIVSRRIPHGSLPVRSTTALRKECLIPYRLDLAGGWLDQPYVSKYCPGAVLTISIEPDYEFNDRSGMSTSSRKKAVELWQTDIPEGDKEKLARTLFCFENPPGTKYVSGSQDSLGIVFPGLNRFYYDGDYWPESIESITDSELLEWIEQRLWLVPLSPRHAEYDVLANTLINEADAKRLSHAAEACWHALKSKDVSAWGKASSESFDAQVAMFPNMIVPEVLMALESYKSSVLGWKISGAGGGGYLVLISEQPVENAIQIRIRRG
ncbi:adenylyltransferase/cytidyltransferase family protein [Tannerella sp.]|uniref:adenylyltransferase/cytidyltransferase family protein n=1 Tax=Tannerella sp. TaxID=2382127 RepID=UPI0026DBD44B|nr:adenylyltransferase/cytidyltransferase family protein [Tannerella sp.]MDO4704132.1 adenylyltransferase/cytidyltransferase family protein [Tannerella sp.]